MSALDRALAAASLGRLTPAHIRDMALEPKHDHEWVCVTNYGMTWDSFEACWCGATRPIPCEHPVSWRTLDDTGKAYCAACTTLVPE